MNICPNCERNIFENDTVCTNCGTPIDAPAAEAKQIEQPYGGLLSAGTFLFVCSIIAGVLCIITAFLQLGDPKAIESAIIWTGVGVGVFIQGLIVNGLIRLAVSVANDIHNGLSTVNGTMSVHTRLLASAANAANTVEQH